MSFKNLKRKRLNVSDLVEQANKDEGGRGERKVDERFWYPQRDKAGNGYAVIRFLPGLDEAGAPWARYWDHGFQGPTGQWYIETSLTTVGQADPVSEMNMDMWNNPSKHGMSKSEAEKTVRSRKRQLHYVANVYIISDPANPENEGQVRLFRFGKKIFDKIKEAMQPQFPDEEPIVPFDLWEGADFVLKIRVQDRFPNYDASSFKSPGTLGDFDDDKLEEIYNKQYDLTNLDDIMPNKMKTYEQLKERLMLVLGETPAAGRASTQMDDEPQQQPPRRKQQEAAEPPTAEADIDAADDVDVEEDDDTMKYFAELANDDD